jgi:hypothetical protein
MICRLELVGLVFLMTACSPAPSSYRWVLWERNEYIEGHPWKPEQEFVTLAECQAANIQAFQGSLNKNPGSYYQCLLVGVKP